MGGDLLHGLVGETFRTHPLHCRFVDLRRFPRARLRASAGCTVTKNWTDSAGAASRSSARWHSRRAASARSANDGARVASSAGVLWSRHEVGVARSRSAIPGIFRRRRLAFPDLAQHALEVAAKHRSMSSLYLRGSGLRSGRTCVSGDRGLQCRSCRGNRSCPCSRPELLVNSPAASHRSHRGRCRCHTQMLRTDQLLT